MILRTEKNTHSSLRKPNGPAHRAVDYADEQMNHRYETDRLNKKLSIPKRDEIYIYEFYL